MDAVAHQIEACRVGLDGEQWHGRDQILSSRVSTQMCDLHLNLAIAPRATSASDLPPIRKSKLQGTSGAEPYAPSISSSSKTHTRLTHLAS